jgi:hypothetical protein
VKARKNLNFSTIMSGWRVVRDRRRLRDAEVKFAAHQKDTEAMRLPMLQRQSCSCSETRAICAPKHDVGQSSFSLPQFRDVSRDDFAISRIRGASRVPTGSGGEVECGQGGTGDGGEGSGTAKCQVTPGKELETNSFAQWGVTNRVLVCGP